MTAAASTPPGLPEGSNRVVPGFADAGADDTMAFRAGSGTFGVVCSATAGATGAVLEISIERPSLAQGRIGGDLAHPGATVGLGLVPADAAADPLARQEVTGLMPRCAQPLRRFHFGSARARD